MTPGANADGYWGGHDVVQHIQGIAQLLKDVHPGCDITLVFANP